MGCHSVAQTWGDFVVALASDFKLVSGCRQVSMLMKKYIGKTVRHSPGTSTETKTAELPKDPLDHPQTEHLDRWQIQFSLDLSMLPRVLCLLSDMKLHCCTAIVEISFIGYLTEGKSFLSSRAGTILYAFLCNIATPNTDLPIVGIHGLLLNSLKVIWVCEGQQSHFLRRCM
jgi:hypothetical protein